MIQELMIMSNYPFFWKGLTFMFRSYAKSPEGYCVFSHVHGESSCFPTNVANVRHSIISPNLKTNQPTVELEEKQGHTSDLHQRKLYWLWKNLKKGLSFPDNSPWLESINHHLWMHDN